ncbi:MAG TPA: TetR/AcrR family transcriptional regulator [Polyangiaceae bacterium]|jgi:TetR/AcrR family transcriptional repressor of nem operon|nr:TetR/AcrR family transcriptional regulator [Polyangiaceae bacterium]
MNAKIEQKERSHETILESAASLLRARGISGARVADVMKGAGLTVGGFYAHFASKESLVDEALRRTGAGLRERLFSRIDEKPEADRAEVVLKRYLSAAHRDAQTLGCPLPAVVGEIGTTAGEHRDVLAEEIEALSSGLEEYLPHGTQATPRRGVPRRALALGLVALMVGGLSLARALRGTPLSDEMIRACRTLGAAVARGTTKT